MFTGFPVAVRVDQDGVAQPRHRHPFCRWSRCRSEARAVGNRLMSSGLTAEHNSRPATPLTHDKGGDHVTFARRYRVGGNHAEPALSF